MQKVEPEAAFGGPPPHFGLARLQLPPSIRQKLRHHRQSFATRTANVMAEPQRDFEKLRAEQEKEDADIFDDLEKESKAFDKVIQDSSHSQKPVSSPVDRIQKSSAS